MTTTGTAFASFRDEAPADEYFGPYKVSILEIRNRLMRFEGKPDRELHDPGNVHGVDAVELAIEDWQRHYPRDSWVPAYLERVVRIYMRGRVSHNPHARHAYALLVHHYARDRHAREVAQAGRRMSF